MYEVAWTVMPDWTWTGRGYCDAPWLTRKFDTRAEAEAVAARVDGTARPWVDRRTPKRDAPPPDADGCPF